MKYSMLTLAETGNALISVLSQLGNIKDPLIIIFRVNKYIKLKT